MDVLIHGEIPPRAGLSSSSALVCCAAICTSHVAAGEAFTDVSRKSVAELCAQCERYIGTEGGGMDQAICLLGEEGKALNITFNPLRTTSVFLPPGYVFVVCHSCVQMNKAATSHFNERVVECRLASQVLAKLGGMDWRSIRTLSELQEKCGCDLAEMVKTVESVLHKEPYTKEEICTILSIDNHTFRHLCLNSNTEHMTDFKLSQRAIHVYSEANRVKEFVSVCNSPQSSVEKLGDLMNGSHQSCSQLYECSCPDLDELVSVCRESGAIGSRLTGAGWGGCTVSLVLEEDVGDFLKNVKEKYYEKSDHRIGYFNEAVFVTKPANGATVQLF